LAVDGAGECGVADHSGSRAQAERAELTGGSVGAPEEPGHVPMSGANQNIGALCGGVGRAKLAYGLNRVLGEKMTVVVNTGDEFEHLGLAISPDLAAVVYTPGEVADEGRGWGRAEESWHFMESLAGLAGETWFRLGDRDLALHVLRSHALRSGAT